MGPYPKLARGNGTLKVTSTPQTVDQMLKAIQHFNPKSGVKAAPRFGRLQGFKPMRIPIVFHCECLGACECRVATLEVAIAMMAEQKRKRGRGVHCCSMIREGPCSLLGVLDGSNSSRSNKTFKRHLETNLKKTFPKNFQKKKNQQVQQHCGATSVPVPTTQQV
jgi:hypothetical protein